MYIKKEEEAAKVRAEKEAGAPAAKKRKTQKGK